MSERFLVFAGSNYYPEGGWGDFKSWHPTAEAARAAAAEFGRSMEWYQIVDSETGMVRSGEFTHEGAMVLERDGTQ